MRAGKRGWRRGQVVNDHRGGIGGGIRSEAEVRVEVELGVEGKLAVESTELKEERMKMMDYEKLEK